MWNFCQHVSLVINWIVTDTHSTVFFFAPSFQTFSRLEDALVGLQFERKGLTEMEWLWAQQKGPQTEWELREDGSQ